MPNLIAAISTCEVTNYDGLKSRMEDGQLDRSRWIRETWLPKARRLCDVRFFYADPTPCPIPWSREFGDRIDLVGIPDGYANLTTKTWAMFKWVYDRGYGHMLKLDDDNLLHIGRFLASDYEQHDYVGNEHQGTLSDGTETTYASGAGYVLSRKAIKVLLDHEIPPDWAEDRQVGLILREGGIQLHDDKRYVMCACTDCLPKLPADYITMHCIPPNSMKEIYEKATA